MFKAIKSSNILFFYSICLGFLVCVATYGVYVLNPTYDAWLLNTGGTDTVQHYLGWMFYRSSPWHFPLGLIDNLVYPYQVSIIYTDSIPIFALFFKLLSPILPETFQYFGFWALLCFILTTFFSSLIIFRLTNNIYYSMICAVFFTLMPSIFQRMFAHSALAGQWIILLGIYLCVSKDYYSRFKLTIFWSFAFALAVGIHGYFVGMLGFLFLGYILSEFYKNKFKAILSFIFPILSAIFAMWILGAFYFVAKIGFGDYGIYSTNLNWLINSMTWNDPNVLFSNFNFMLFKIHLGQQEGMAYIGFGVLILLFSLIILLFIKFNKAKHYFKNIDFYIIVFILLCILFFALSNEIYLGENKIFSVQLSQKIIDICSIFRSSGRFIWLVNYSLFVIIFYFIYKNFTYKYLFIILALFIQFYDLSSFFKNYKIEQNVEYKNTFLDILPKNKNIISLDDYPENQANLYKMAYYASKNNTSINDFNIARKNNEKIAEYKNKIIEELNQGIIKDDTIYAFSTDLYKKYENILNFKQKDGITLAWKK